jgi:hypothetical protein
MIAEDKESAPRVGDRIIYTFKRSHVKAVAHEKAETVTRIIENGFDIDYEHIYHKRVINPLKTILEVVLGDKERCQKIFYGPHLKRFHGTKVVENSMFGLGKFFKKVDTCYVCKIKLGVGEEHACKACIDDNTKIHVWYESKKERLEKFTQKHATALEECLKCQVGDEVAAKECSNQECPVYLSRLTIGQELITLGPQVRGCGKIMKEKRGMNVTNDIEEIVASKIGDEHSDDTIQLRRGVIRELESPQNPPQKKKNFMSGWLVPKEVNLSEPHTPLDIEDSDNDEVEELQSTNMSNSTTSQPNETQVGQKRKNLPFTFEIWSKKKKTSHGEQFPKKKK